MGSPRWPPGPFPYPRAPDRSTVRRVCDRPAASSRFVSPLQSSFTIVLARALSGRAHCQGFVPSSRPHQHASTRDRDPALLGSVHRRSQPLDGLLRALAPGLVASPSRVQDTGPFRGLLSPRRAARLVTGQQPPWRWRPRAHRASQLDGRTRSRRLRGVAPRGAAFTSNRLFTGTRAAPLIGFVSPGYATPRAGPASASHFRSWR